MEDYSKTPFTYEQHIELLKSRGLKIDNPEYAIKFLDKVNYYRFTAYCVPFQKPHDVFIPNTTFEEIITLYKLDGELRSAVFAVITLIEIYLRTQFAYRLSHKYGSFAHYETSVFQNDSERAQWIKDLEEDIVSSKEPFLEHYQNKYNGFPQIPIWMSCEIMSLGHLSSFYSLLTRENRLIFCSILDADHNVVRTWLHTITFLRNICAHHGRLWSRNFSISPMIPDKKAEWKIIEFNNKKLFASVAVMEWICRKAELALCDIEPIYETMQKIADMDNRFPSWMGVPRGKDIAPLWGNIL